MYYNAEGPVSDELPAVRVAPFSKPLRLFVAVMNIYPQSATSGPAASPSIEAMSVSNAHRLLTLAHLCDCQHLGPIQPFGTIAECWLS